MTVSCFYISPYPTLCDRMGATVEYVPTSIANQIWYSMQLEKWKQTEFFALNLQKYMILML